MDFYTDNNNENVDNQSQSYDSAQNDNSQNSENVNSSFVNNDYAQNRYVYDRQTDNDPYHGNGGNGSKRAKGSGFGTGFAIVTLLAILIVLITSAVVFNNQPSLPIPPVTPSVTNSALPKQTLPLTTQDASGGIDLTPMPIVTNRPMANLDGILPVIDDLYNPFPDIIEGVSSGVVSIINYEAPASIGPITQEVVQATGSGFVISSDGYILTNAHVIEDAHSVSVAFFDGTEVKANIIGFDSVMDVAVLYVDIDLSSIGVKPLKTGNSSTCRVGEFVIAIGDPTGTELAGSPTFGIVSALSREINIAGHTNAYIQTDAAINPGNSGGPLINNIGEVIGMTTAKTTTASYDEYGNAISAEGLGFALPINSVLSIVEQLITNGEVARPGIGLSTVSIDEFTANKYNKPIGLLVYSVIEDAPAFNAGLRADDIIIECQGKTLSDNTELSAIIKTLRVGDEIQIKYWRDGEYFTCSIVLGDLNHMGSTIYNDEYGGAWWK